jgi:hypothetical protein
MDNVQNFDSYVNKPIYKPINLYILEAEMLGADSYGTPYGACFLYIVRLFFYQVFCISLSIPYTLLFIMPLVWRPFQMLTRVRNDVMYIYFRHCGAVYVNPTTRTSRCL